jgi:hypothetical protein
VSRVVVQLKSVLFCESSGEIVLVRRFSFQISGSVFIQASFPSEEIVRLESVIWTTLRVGVK